MQSDPGPTPGPASAEPQHATWSDEELARAAAELDHLAFAELYRRYHPIFASYARARLPDAVGDVVQGVFVKIHRGLPGFSGPRFFSWAFRICANTVVDELRRRRRRPYELVADDADVSGEEARAGSGAVPTPEEELVARQLCDQLSGALEALPVEQRTVFVLARIDQLPYAEISALLNIPVGTVKSRMFAATRALFARGEES